MKKTLTLLFVLSIVSATASFAAKVTIDYAHHFDFSTVESFFYVDTGDTNASNSLTDGRIKEAIAVELTSAGLEKKPSGGDLGITYHVTTEDQTVLNTSTYGYGGRRGPGWRGYGRRGVGMSTSTTTASTFTEGTLVVDAYSPANKELIWRGTGTITLKDDPAKQAKQAEKIMNKLGKKWQKILKNQGK